jgi:hypothetical protein
MDALKLTEKDMDGPVRIELGKVHVKQMNRIFATQGRTGASGAWPKLNPKYKARKTKVFGRKKILQLSGDMKTRFTKRKSPHYISEYVRTTIFGGHFRFGARSSVAAAHREGNPLLAGKGPPRSRLFARRVFGGIAPRLPIRDMVSKTKEHMEQMKDALRNWYIKKRVEQVLRHHERLLRATNPRRR